MKITNTHRFTTALTTLFTLALAPIEQRDIQKIVDAKLQELTPLTTTPPLTYQLGSTPLTYKLENIDPLYGFIYVKALQRGLQCLQRLDSPATDKLLKTSLNHFTNHTQTLNGNLPPESIFTSKESNFVIDAETTLEGMPFYPTIWLNSPLFPKFAEDGTDGMAFHKIFPSGQKEDYHLSQIYFHEFLHQIGPGDTHAHYQPQSIDKTVACGYCCFGHDSYVAKWYQSGKNPQLINEFCSFCTEESSSFFDYARLAIKTTTNPEYLFFHFDQLAPEEKAQVDLDASQLWMILEKSSPEPLGFTRLFNLFLKRNKLSPQTKENLCSEKWFEYVAKNPYPRNAQEKQQRLHLLTTCLTENWVLNKNFWSKNNPKFNLFLYNHKEAWDILTALRQNNGLPLENQQAIAAYLSNFYPYD